MMQSSQHTWCGCDNKHCMRFLISCLFYQYDKKENCDNKFELSDLSS